MSNVVQLRKYPWYAVDLETKEIFWKRKHLLEPHQYPNTNFFRVSLYVNWKPCYLSVKQVLEAWANQLALEKECWEMIEYFKEKDKDRIRRDILRKHFEHDYIDQCVELEAISETKENWHKYYSLV